MLPVLLILPQRKGPHPVVVMVAQGGRAAFLKQRAADIDQLLRAGVAVCLVDVRGTGESRVGASGDRTSSRTSLAQTELILGRTVLGNQLRDVRTTLAWLRGTKRFQPDRLFVWGDSFAEPYPTPPAAVPLDVELPRHAEPGAGELALLAGLFEEDVRGVVARGVLTSYAGALQLPVGVPLDAVVPGGDLPALVAVLGERASVRNPVDGRNVLAAPGRPVPAEFDTSWLRGRVIRR